MAILLDWILRLVGLHWIHFLESIEDAVGVAAPDSEHSRHTRRFRGERVKCRGPLRDPYPARGEP